MIMKVDQSMKLRKFIFIAATALAENSLAMRTTSRGEGPLAAFFWLNGADSESSLNGM